MLIDLLVLHFTNIGRVENLVRVYESLPTVRGSGRKRVQDGDILRCAVVLLHATFEDMCSTIERRALPRCGDSDIIDQIPLVGLSRIGRPEKFLLGKLIAHRSKTVQQVIEESVGQHLERSSYNSVEEFCAFLARVGFEKSKFEGEFASLGDMIARRHRIVHQADRNPHSGHAGNQRAQSLGTKTVRRWKSAVEKTLFALNSECSRLGYRA
jgi:hypothetical protein